MTDTPALRIDMHRVLRVLLVERDFDLLEMVATIIQQCGHTSQQVNSGLDAMDSALTHRPDVVVTSLRLPDCRGDELANRLRSDPRTASVITVLLTGETVSRLPIEATRAFNYVIQKPFPVEKLVELLSFHAASAPDSRAPHTQRT